MSVPSRQGATLLEVVVVIATLGILTGMILVGVQNAREAANRATCQNHLRQVGLAWMNHHAAHGYFPTKGTGSTPVLTYSGVGSPAVGGPRWDDQHGSWLFQILPYIEQDSAWRQAGAKDVDAAASNALGTVIPIYFCPSRPRPKTWEPPLNELSNPPIGLVRAGNDYAGNSGASSATPNEYPKPPNGIFGHAPSYGRGGGWVLAAAQVTDGLSNTVMVGERRIRPQWYAGPVVDENMFGYAQSSETETCASGAAGEVKLPPASDRLRDAPQPYSQFGSAHPAGMNVVLADGSVRTVPYSINPDVWTLLCVRNDGRSLPDY